MALLTRLRELLSHLDYKRYITLARLLYHLNRFADFSLISCVYRYMYIYVPYL